MLTAAMGDELDTFGQMPKEMLFTPDGEIKPLRDIRADVLRTAVRRYSGRKAEIGRHLGIPRMTLGRALERLSTS
jgi:DNA-binding NtrC family response regulator